MVLPINNSGFPFIIQTAASPHYPVWEKTMLEIELSEFI
jgi:hypothetical protein